MATSNGGRQLAALTIPAEYLEDMRTALVWEIEDDGDRLRANQALVVSARRNDDLDREDRDDAVNLLRKDMQLLEQLLDATEDAEATADADTIADVLQTMVRILAKQLRKEMIYGPLHMGRVLDLGGRLRWAAEEAIRIDPTLAPVRTAAVA
jgi:hypothetical protein